MLNYDSDNKCGKLSKIENRFSLIAELILAIDWSSNIVTEVKICIQISNKVSEVLRN